jgi:hypothetical protein
MLGSSSVTEQLVASQAKSWDSDGLDGPSSIPSSVSFSILHSVQTESEAHPVSYPLGTGGSFHEGKAAEA